MDGDGTAGPPPEPARPAALNVNARQIFRNVVSSYGNFFLALVMSLFVTRVLLRHLGAGRYGLWIVLLGLVGYIGLLDVGVSTAAVQRVARLMADHDRDGVADLIRTAWAFFALSGVIAVLITVVLAPFLASFLHLGTIDPTQAATTLIVLGLATAATFLASVPNAVLFGSGRGDRLTQIGGITLVLTQAGQIAVVLAGGGLVAVAVVWLCGVAVGLVVTAAMVGRVTGSSIRRGHFRGAVLTDLLRFGGRQSVISLGGIIAYQLDAVIIGLILPVAQVAPYDIALSTANLTRNLSVQGTNMLLPTFTHLEVTGERERQTWYFFRSVLAGMAITVPIVIALAAFGDPMLVLWLGKVPAKTYEIMIALGIMITLQLPGNQCFNFLTGVGRVQLMVKLTIIGALINLAGSVAFTFWLGPIGPAIGSLPVVVVFDFFVLPAIVCRYLGAPYSAYFRTALAPLVLPSLTAGITAAILILSVPGPKGVTSVLEAGAVVVVAWVTLGLLLLRIEPEFRDAARQLVRRGRRKGRSVVPPEASGS